MMKNGPFSPNIVLEFTTISINCSKKLWIVPDCSLANCRKQSWVIWICLFSFHFGFKRMDTSLLVLTCSGQEVTFLYPIFSAHIFFPLASLRYLDFKVLTFAWIIEWSVTMDIMNHQRTLIKWYLARVQFGNQSVGQFLFTIIWYRVV